MNIVRLLSVPDKQDQTVFKVTSIVERLRLCYQSFTGAGILNILNTQSSVIGWWVLPGTTLSQHI